MTKAIRYFAFSLIDSQSADAFVSRQKMNNALAFEMTESQITEQQVCEGAVSATWIAMDGASIAPLSEKELARAFKDVTKSDWIKAEILPDVYQRDAQFRHGARTHQWAPDYINPVSFKVYIHRSGQIISHGRPRMARECLEPAGQGGIILGTIDDLDSFYEANPYPDYEHPAQSENEDRLRLTDTLQYCSDLLSFVCKGSLENPSEGLRYAKLDKPLLLLSGDQDASIKPLLSVYDSIETLKPSTPCLERFSAPLTNATSYPCRQTDTLRTTGLKWGTLQPTVMLSEDQTQAVHATLSMVEGDILAINGPPGTGKTAILKEIVATLVVRSVLANQPPPLIAISSTNNQAIRNAMESLTKFADSEFPLHQRWVTEVPGFAVYAVSQHGESLANEHDLFTARRLDELEQGLDLPQATVRFIRKTNAYLKPKSALTSLEECCAGLKSRLSQQAKLQSWAFRLPKNLNNARSPKDIKQVMARSEQCMTQWIRSRAISHSFAQAWRALLAELADAVGTLDELAVLDEQLTAHVAIIHQTIASHPILKRCKWLADSSWGRRIAKPAIRKALGENKQDMAYVTEARAGQHYKELKRNVLRSAQQTLSRAVKGPAMTQWTALAEEELGKNWRSDWFWLAIHIREGEWLAELRDTIRAKDLDKRTQDKVLRRLTRQARITPVIVATLHRLPKVASHWDIAKQCELPLFNVLDTLIIDEAGQSAPDIAAASLALTKRAVFFGDRAQLEPIWSVSEREDVGNRIASGILTKQQAQGHKGEQFHATGGATSAGSALWLAQKTTCFTEPRNEAGRAPGIWLTVNRRSVPDILGLSNELCYEGSLVAARTSETASPFPGLAVMEIAGRCSESMGSRVNQMEAMMISNWVVRQRHAIELAYQKPLSECLAIVTPFKAQSDYLKARIHRQLGKDNAMTVGTIHSLQGAERPIVIMSLTYTAEGQPQSMFFDRNPTMLNVAASRAQDSFIVMGDLDTLTRSQGSAKILAEHLQDKARPLPWVPWHADQESYVGAIWGSDATASVIQSPVDNGLQMALSDESIASIIISTSEIECGPLQSMGSEMIRAAKRGCEVMLLVSQRGVLKHPEAERIGRGFDAMQASGVKIRYMPTVLSNRACLSNGMTLITSESWFSSTPPSQILLVQGDQGYERTRMLAAYGLDPKAS
jgi:hypothetical protein